MGAHIAKELGVFNEEERIRTPVGPQRYRLLNNDPRSATSGIVRTPIQVECTPTNTRTTPERIPVSECSQVENSEAKENVENDSGFKEEMESSDDIKEVIERISPQAYVKYLETDIDKIDSPTVKLNSPAVIHHSSLIKEDKCSNSRSPSLLMDGTPVLVECTPELFALHSRIDSLSFCDFDVHMDDPSAILSDDEQSNQHQNQSTINNWLVNVDSKTSSDTPVNNSFVDSPRKVAKKQKELNALKKQLFFTPDLKEASKPKARMPLGNLQASQVQYSPQQLMRTKQWRNIPEERQRLGLLDTENTPPNLPPLTHVSSAPGKILDRKRTKKIDWDEENAMLI